MATSAEIDALIRKLKDAIPSAGSPGQGLMLEAADLLDAARPQRREPPLGCWCPDGNIPTTRWTWHAGMWVRWCENGHRYELPAGAFCNRCGTFLGRGYAERGGDTRRIEVLIAMAEAAQPVTVCLGKWGMAAERSWYIGVDDPQHCGPDLRAAIDTSSPAEPGGDEQGEGGEEG